MQHKKSFFQKFKLELITIAIAIFSIILGISLIIISNQLFDIICAVVLIVMEFLLIVNIYYCSDKFDINNYAIILFVVITLLIVVLVCLCLLYASVGTALFIIIFGIYIIVNGITATLIDSINCAKAHVKGWVVLTLLTIISIMLGVVITFGPFYTLGTNKPLILVKVCLIIYGTCETIRILLFSRKIESVKTKMLDDRKKLLKIKKSIISRFENNLNKKM